MVTLDGRPVAYRPGMTLANILEENHAGMGVMVLVIVDNKVVPASDYRSCSISENSTIQIREIISGG
jgi:thiamine biosynthesis protein ThiS